MAAGDVYVGADKISRVYLGELDVLELAADPYTSTESPPQANVGLTPIPFSDPEIQNPMRGLYSWLYPTDEQDKAPTGGPGSGRDLYARGGSVNWNLMEPTQGSYNFSILETYAAAAAARGGQFGFRIALMGMGVISTPAYIRNNPGTYGGSGTGAGYNPNFNNSAFLARVEALFAAIGAQFGNDKRFGVCDIGIYGMWGEWHLFGASGVTPINLASAKRIIDAHVDNLPHAQMVMLYGNSAVSDAVAYAMGKQSSAGQWVGWRNDALGHETQGHAHTGSACWNGGTNPQRDQWKRAPVIAEVANIGPNDTTFDSPTHIANWALAKAQVEQYHYAAVGNGNTTSGYSAFSTQKKLDWVNTGKRAGYRYELTSVSMATKPTPGVPFVLTAAWRNAGVAPVYRPWQVRYLLKNAGGQVVWSGGSTLNLRTLLPSSTAVTVPDTFTLPAGLAPGTYSLSVQVADLGVGQLGPYFTPMKLPLAGRAADGSYPVLSGLTF